MSEEQETADEIGQLVDDAVKAAFEHVTNELQAARPDVFGLSMSGLGRCRRAAAYALARTEPSDPDLVLHGEKRAAHLGTAVHRMLLPALAHALGGTHEVPVLLADGSVSGIPGILDLWWPSKRAVVDVKTVREYKLDRVLVHGEEYEHRMQVGGYALAQDARWVVWLYLDRSSGQTVRVVEEFGPEFRREVWHRIWEIQKLAETPEYAPRDERGPGLSYQCDGCGWLRRCWGSTARSGESGAQAHIAVDEPAVEAALAQYAMHRDEEGRHKKLKAFWRAVATGGGRKPGTYGRWRYHFTKPGYGLDQKTIRKDYADRGVEVPVKEEAGRLMVRPAKK
ncbi:PD-(D/E)XK nuclease family protein [Streptomyces sp. NPDC101213]|uniref:PD-(D/E)XK nuclease family protein n=1 Tax=Streptomyces sp. NPDC101213 TaxID=3366130 RepID=UPI0038196ADD